MSCKRSQEKSTLYGIEKGGDLELVFSDDLIELDIFYNNVEFENNKVGALYESAMSSWRNNNPEGAREALLKAHNLEPLNPVILTGLGNVANHYSQYEAAIDYHQQAISSSDSTFLEAFHNLGVTYLEQKDYQNSTKTFQHILDNSNDAVTKVGAHYILAKAFLGLKECREAKRHFEEYYRLTKNSNNFAVMQEALFLRIQGCADNAFGNEGSFVNNGHKFMLSLRSSPPTDAEDPSQTGYLLELTREEVNNTQRLWLSKANFELSLYTEFFEESHLCATQIVGVLNNKVFLSSRMSRKDSSRNAEIRYAISLRNDQFGDLQVEQVSYSPAEQNYRKELAAENH